MSISSNSFASTSLTLVPENIRVLDQHRQLIYSTADRLGRECYGHVVAGLPRHAALSKHNYQLIQHYKKPNAHPADSLDHCVACEDALKLANEEHVKNMKDACVEHLYAEWLMENALESHRRQVEELEERVLDVAGPLDEFFDFVKERFFGFDFREHLSKEPLLSLPMEERVLVACNILKYGFNDMTVHPGMTRGEWVKVLRRGVNKHKNGSGFRISRLGSK